MAILHNLAGQHGKRQAKRRWRHGLALLIVAFVVFNSIIFISMGWLLAKGLWEAASGIMLVIVWACLALLVWGDRYTDKLAKERIVYLRGAQAEALIAWHLKSLDDVWHVFNGVMVEGARDTDHIVIGPGGVFCISCKSRRGWFEGLPDGLWHNKKRCDFAHEVRGQAMTLKERLNAESGETLAWVHAVLALPFGWVDGESFHGDVWLKHADTLVPRIEATRKTPKTRLDAAQIGRLVAAVEKIAVAQSRDFVPVSMPMSAAGGGPSTRG